MAVKHYYIAQGDLLPNLTMVLLDSRGSVVAVDSGVSSILFEMRNLETGGTIGGAMTADGGGTVSYPWVSGDTAIPGDYEGKAIVTWTSGLKTQTFPNTKRNRLMIHIEQAW